MYTNQRARVQNPDNPSNPSLQHNPDSSSIHLHPQNTTKLSQISLIPLDHVYLPRQFSYISDNMSSFTTEQVLHSNRVSVLIDDATEISFSQFRFERKVQNSLKMIKCPLYYCDHCQSTTYCIEKHELQSLNPLQFLSYWFKYLKCCSEPKVLREYYIKKMFCIYCGNNINS